MTDLSPALMDELRAVAAEIADAARVETLKYFRSGSLGTENKRPADFDPVTVADRAAEQAMRGIVEKRRPDDAILGEEYGYTPGTSGLTWVFDPIDGTRGYISGMPTWGVLIGLRNARGAIFGIIDQPYTGERFEGGFGVAMMTGPHWTRPLGPTNTTEMSRAILFSTYPEVGSRAEQVAFDAVSASCKLTRFGADCYAYALLAAGQIDLVIEAGLQSYDILAPAAVIEAAGGIVTDWKGNPAYDGGRIVAAATPALHDQVLEILSKV